VVTAATAKAVAKGGRAVRHRGARSAQSAGGDAHRGCLAILRLMEQSEVAYPLRDLLLSACHSRDQTHEVEIGFDGDGKILPFRDNFLVDCGTWSPTGS